MSRIISCCVTLNNYTEEDYVRLTNIQCNYLIVGKEVGESGTPHLQCYFKFKNARTFASLKKEMGDKAHIEKAAGNAQHNQAYCSKGGDYIEKGVLPIQGKRTELVECLKLAKEEGLKRAAEEYPATMIRYHKGITYVRDLGFDERDWEMFVIVLHGDSGSGKTTLAHELAHLNGGTAYYKPDGEWWDRYDGQSTVILDDFYGGIKFSFLLKLLDSKPLLIPYKGGFAQFRSKFIIITSNQPPEKWYSFEDYNQKLPSLIRRLNGGIWAINDTHAREQTKKGLIDRIHNLLSSHNNITARGRSGPGGSTDLQEQSSKQRLSTSIKRACLDLPDMSDDSSRKRLRRTLSA